MIEKEQYYEWLYSNLDTPDVWEIILRDPNVQKKFRTPRSSKPGLIEMVTMDYQAPAGNYEAEIRENIDNIIMNERLNGAEKSVCGRLLDYILTDRGRHDLLERFAKELEPDVRSKVISEFLSEAESKGAISGRLKIQVQKRSVPKFNHVEGYYDVKLLLGNSGEEVLFDDKKWNKWGKLLYLFFLLHPGERIPRSSIGRYEEQFVELYWEAFRKVSIYPKSDVLPGIRGEIKDFLNQRKNSGNDKFSHAKSMANKAVGEALKGHDIEKWYIIDTEKDGQKAVYILRMPQENIVIPEELKMTI